MWPEKPIEFVKLKEDNTGTHYGLYIDDRLTSVVSCFEYDREFQFRKFATLKEKQKMGFGSYLLNYIINDAKNKGIKRIWCNARADRRDFYKKFGMTETDALFFKEGIEYTIMEIRFD